MRNKKNSVLPKKDRERIYKLGCSFEKKKDFQSAKSEYKKLVDGSCFVGNLCILRLYLNEDITLEENFLKHDCVRKYLKFLENENDESYRKQDFILEAKKIIPLLEKFNKNFSSGELEFFQGCLEGRIPNRIDLFLNSAKKGYSLSFQKIVLFLQSEHIDSFPEFIEVVGDFICHVDINFLSLLMKSFGSIENFRSSFLKQIIFFCSKTSPANNKNISFLKAELLKILSKLFKKDRSLLEKIKDKDKNDSKKIIDSVLKYDFEEIDSNISKFYFDSLIENPVSLFKNNAITWIFSMKNSTRLPNFFLKLVDYLKENIKFFDQKTLEDAESTCIFAKYFFLKGELSLSKELYKANWRLIKDSNNFIEIISSYYSSLDVSQDDESEREALDEVIGDGRKSFHEAEQDFKKWENSKENNELLLKALDNYKKSASKMNIDAANKIN